MKAIMMRKVPSLTINIMKDCYHSGPMYCRQMPPIMRKTPRTTKYGCKSKTMQPSMCSIEM